MGSIRSIWILGNQLLKEHPALELIRNDTPINEIRILMIESERLIKESPSFPAKLVLVISAMRHYAESLRKAGYQVDYRRSPTFRAGILDHVRDHQPADLTSMAASDYQARQFQQSTLPKILKIPVQLHPNTQFLVGRYDPYPNHPPDKVIRQESFYRRMRAHFNLLIDEGGNPLGGKWNYDAQNRKPLPPDLPLPDMLSFSSDKITREVTVELGMDQENRKMPGFNLAVDHDGAKQALEDFIRTRLARFGPYEDAMTSRSGLVFHSFLSPYLNLGLLEPLETLQSVEKAYLQGDAPLNSAEGFIRQVLGWREYMYWQYWRKMPALLKDNHFNAQRGLPAFFWNGKTDLNCLGTVTRRALSSGYNHHIERLMILSNFCTLAGIQPRQVLDWFMANYLDAYPWVMVSNLIGMGLHADGGGIGTKPYISSANYINKMSDFCQSCGFDHRKRVGRTACPFNYLYWYFLDRHDNLLRSNTRMNLSLRNLARLDKDEREKIKMQAQDFLSGLNSR